MNENKAKGVAVPRNSGGSSEFAVLICVLVFFFFSGASALLYEVVWTRKLALLFGTTTYAVSMVLSVYFAGMGIGSYFGGILADRSNRPLLLYAVFEIIIGLYAVVFLFLLREGESLLIGILQAFSVSRETGLVLRGALSVFLLLLPVSLLGATLPLLARAVVTRQRVLGLRIGSLYSVNTFGAVAGCFAAGFLLLPNFGYSTAMLIGAAANLSVGFAAVALALVTGRIGSKRDPGGATEGDTVPDASEEVYSKATANLVLAAFAVSGFCALAFEVLWFRTLTIIFLGTTYAFTTMLTTFLCGIALGSWYASRSVDRRRHLVSYFGVLEALIGVSGIFVLTLYTWLPSVLRFFETRYQYEWSSLVPIKFVLAFGVLFIPTFLFGMTFPVALKIVVRGRESFGSKVGVLYGSNTFGGVAGSLCAGFVLLPLLGTHRGIEWIAALSFGVGIVLILACRTRWLPWKVGLAVSVTVLLALCVQIRPLDMARSLNTSYLPPEDRMIHYQEAIEGTVVISEVMGGRLGSDRTLWINGSPASSSIDKGVKMYRLEGLLPMLFDRDPKTALLMCYGTGLTAGTLAQFGLDRIDGVDISRAVLESSHFFAVDNFNVIDAPNVNLIVDDGRNFLLTTREQYDVITFSPMPLALAGVSTFYTREYYELCLKHLNPGGIVSQWIPLHSLNPEIVRSLVRTFYVSFPESSMWFTNSDIFMLGSDRPLVVDYALLKERIAIPTIRDALREADLGDIDELLVCFFMSKENIDEYSRGAPLMTDDYPWAEFVAPKGIYANTVERTLREMMPYYENPIRIMRFSGLTAQEVDEATARIVRRYESHRASLEGVMSYYSGSASMADPLAGFKEALALDPSDLTAPYYIKEIALQTAQHYLASGRIARAIGVLTEAIELAPNQAILYETLGGIYRRQLEQEDKAAEYFEAHRRLLEEGP